jgi:hypothetical protein
MMKPSLRMTTPEPEPWNSWRKIWPNRSRVIWTPSLRMNTTAGIASRATSTTGVTRRR